MPQPEEMTTPKRITETGELANQQCAATINELTNQSQVQTKRGTNALTAFKQKAKETKRKRNQNKKKLKKLEQITEEIESDLEDETPIQTEPKEVERHEKNQPK